MLKLHLPIICIALLVGCSRETPPPRVEHVVIIKVVEPTHDENNAIYNQLRDTLSKPYTVVQTRNSYNGNTSPGQRYIVPGIWGEPGEDFDLRTDIGGVIASR